MTDKLPVIDIVSAVRSAAHDVFSLMLNLPLEDRPHHERIEKDPPENADGVEAMVGIAGTWIGTGRICCTPQFACRVASALLMAECPGLNEEVLDAMAEVANMIIGNVKTHFEETLGPLDLSIPMVVFGHNYKTRSIGAPSWVVVPFQTGECAWEIRFCLMPSRTRSHAQQPAMLQWP